jgi:uncharacterized membrane protein YdjX (TVP38/TMEM64 family)
MRQYVLIFVLAAAASAAGIASLVLAVTHWAPMEAADLADLMSVQQIEDLVASWGAWGPLVSVLLMVVHSFVPFPAELLASANGMLFGLVLGTAVTWVGAMLGALVAFGLARRFGRPLVLRLLSERHRRVLDTWTARSGAGGLLLARLVPAISFNLVNYAAGLAGVGWWTFTWTTAIGILPVTVASVLVGSHMIGAPWHVWVLSVALLLVLWLLHRAYRRPSNGHG